jgi:hypothetical protein
VQKRAADVTLSLFWDQRYKRWTITVTGTKHSEFANILTTSEVGQVEAWLLIQAVKKEMESWLA